MMRLTANLFMSLFILLAFLITGCGNKANLEEDYNDFGIKSARMGLWDEAIMRWNRVIEIDPENAKAHNNLGVAYEATGRVAAAIEEYKTAVELDPENKIYTSNYTKSRRNYERISQNNKTQETNAQNSVQQN